MAGKIVNIDYEYQLFDRSYQQDKYKNICSEFEYVYFWGSEDSAPLATTNRYHNSYLDYLQSLGLNTSIVLPEKKSENWWGRLENLPLEKKINSKKYSYETLADLNLLPENNYLVESVEDLDKIVETNTKDRKYLFRPLEQMGGKGFILDNQLGNLLQTLKKKFCQGIISPFYDRKIDIGFLIKNSKIISSHIIHNTTRGVFKGITYFKEPEELKTYLKSKALLDAYIVLESDIKRVVDRIAPDTLSAMYEIDSFIYLENQQIKTLTMTEINFRRTMGNVCSAASKKFVQYPVSVWRFFDNPFLNVSSELHDLTLRSLIEKLDHISDQNQRALLVSPINSRYLSLMCLGHSFDKVHQLSENIYKNLILK